MMHPFRGLVGFRWRMACTLEFSLTWILLAKRKVLLNSSHCYVIDCDLLTEPLWHPITVSSIPFFIYGLSTFYCCFCLNGSWNFIYIFDFDILIFHTRYCMQPLIKSHQVPVKKTDNVINFISQFKQRKAGWFGCIGERKKIWVQVFCFISHFRWVRKYMHHVSLVSRSELFILGVKEGLDGNW